MTSDPSVSRVLGTTWLIIFVTSLCFRAVDPAIPQIAQGFVMDAGTVALLSTAFALPYAIMQPLLGAFADAFGKTRTMTVCILLVMVWSFAGAIAATFSLLAASRALTGIVTGGIFPIALAIAGDLVPVAQRQVAIGRLLAGAMLGNLLGSPAAGLIGDLFGWRAIFVFMGFTGVIALIAALVGFRDIARDSGGRFDAGEAIANYRAIFRNPLAKYCYGAVFLEGTFLFGLFPYMANLLAAHGEPRASIAGLVLAGFGLGGIVYSLSVSVLLSWLGEKKLMVCGGVIMGIALMIVALRMPWQVEFLNFALMGFGFYMLHGVIQIHASELSSTARGSAMAMHSLFFFTGLAFGPVVYGIWFPTIGVTAALIVAGFIIMLVGVVCAMKLRHSEHLS